MNLLLVATRYNPSLGGVHRPLRRNGRRKATISRAKAMGSALVLQRHATTGCPFSGGHQTSTHNQPQETPRRRHLLAFEHHGFGLQTRTVTTENRFVVRADEKLTAFCGLESVIKKPLKAKRVLNYSMLFTKKGRPR